MTNRAYYENSREVWDIYSMPEQTPKKLLSFIVRGRCTKIGEDGRIYGHGSGGADSNEYSVYKISEGGNSYSVERVWHDFPTYTYYACDDFDPSAEYDDNDVTETILTETEGAAMVDKLSADGDGFDGDIAPFIEFIPLFD
jgi:hypothetical protein